MTTGTAEPQGAFAMFTRGEMERRWDRAQQLMAQRDIDVLFVSEEENFQYYAGATGTLALHYSNTRPAIFVLPVSGEPIAIVGQGLVSSMGLTTYLDDVRGYVGVVTFPHDLVLEALKDALGDGKTVAAELGQEQRMGIPVGSYLALIDALPGIEFVDGAGITVYQRMIKSQEEVAYMKQAADITGRARQRLFDEIVPGMTERDVVRNLRRLILEEGGDRTSFVHLVSDVPGCHSQFHFDRPLKKGNRLYVDAGAYVRTYTIDYPRHAVLGRATEEQFREHQVLLNANQAMIDALRPGIKCSELHRIGAQVLESNGFEVAPIGRMGHGQGIQLTEPPSIAPDDDTVIEEGVVISTEPVASEQLLWEDVHVVTADGSEQLTLETTELREIPFD